MPGQGDVTVSVQYRELSIQLPMRDAASMWDRARKWDIGAGGRFDARADKIVLWSSSRLNKVAERHTLGAVCVLWHMPSYDQATICRLVWHPHDGGTEQMVWRALAVLLGRTTG